MTRKVIAMYLIVLGMIIIAIPAVMNEVRYGHPENDSIFPTVMLVEICLGAVLSAIALFPRCGVLARIRRNTKRHKSVDLHHRWNH